VRFRMATALALLIAALVAVTPAQAHLIKPLKGTASQKHKAAQVNLAHAQGACTAHRRAHTPKSPRSHCEAVPWLKEVVARYFIVANPAWAWYLRGDTQCVVSHEGGWTSVNPAGYYGRFQMDVSFQNETKYGQKAYRRYGTADKWPPIVQVVHAYSIWLYAWWSRWPTYYAYCT